MPHETRNEVRGCYTCTEPVTLICAYERAGQGHTADLTSHAATPTLVNNQQVHSLIISDEDQLNSSSPERRQLDGAVKRRSSEQKTE